MPELTPPVKPPGAWRPTVCKSNFRVEAEWESRASLTEAEAEDFANYIRQLRGVYPHVVFDVSYICPNCKWEALTPDALRGCCEASEELP